jgi:crotonobetainyl-CoA:carnitine CoA-transferase CaiB-like acyl-CoA transferase
LSLNMKTPEAIDIAGRLVAVSDVVAENFSGRVMPSWGLDYPSLRELQPSIIMLSMSGFGRTGPWKEQVSYGQTLQAWSGFTDLTGFPDTDPCGPASAYSDAVAGMTGAQAVLLALIQRASTGLGQWIDLSQFEALTSLLDTLVLDLSVNGRGAKRTGNRLPHLGSAPEGAYRCAGEDRWVAITVSNEEEWQSMVHAMGNPNWTNDHRFSTVLGRLEHADELDGLIGTWTRDYSPEEIMGWLQSMGVASGVVQTGADLAEDPQLKHRGFFRSVPNAAGERCTVEGVPYKLSRTPGGMVGAAPEFGSHQTYVLKELLGMSEDEIADCAIAGAFD